MCLRKWPLLKSPKYHLLGGQPDTETWQKAPLSTSDKDCFPQSPMLLTPEARATRQSSRSPKRGSAGRQGQTRPDGLRCLRQISGETSGFSPLSLSSPAAALGPRSRIVSFIRSRLQLQGLSSGLLRHSKILSLQ